MEKIGLIGTGTMGRAVLGAVGKALPEAQYFLANRTRAKAEIFAKDLKHAAVTDAKAIAETCDTIFLAVKPQNLEEVMAEIAGTLKARKDRFLIISMLAGYSAKDIRAAAGNTCPVIVMMPNPPAAVGAGVILYNSADATEAEEKAFEDALSYAGHVEKCSEKLIGPAGNLTGCGPAMVYMLIGALADAAVLEGIPRAEALRYAALMVSGSAQMAAETGTEPETLKNQVCSPAGLTIQMVRKLEETGFRSSVLEGMIAAMTAKPAK